MSPMDALKAERDELLEALKVALAALEETSRRLGRIGKTAHEIDYVTFGVRDTLNKFALSHPSSDPDPPGTKV